MARLSVVVWPPPGVIDALSSLDRPSVPGVRWSSPEQWMVKVRPLGYVEDRLVPSLVDVLEAELDGAPVVRCVLGPATRRIEGQWLGAPVEGLDALAAVVFDVTEGLVPVTHPQPFQADVVLARGRVPKALAGLPVSASWTARSVSLVADRSSPGDVRHENLAEIPLAG
jgi:2'-5' RNA ligase